MPSLNNIAQNLLKIIAGATERLDMALNSNQAALFSDIELLLKDLDLEGDRIANTAKNIKQIGALKNRIEKAILNKEYISEVRSYTAAFAEVSRLQQSYFSTLSSEVGTSKILDAIKNQSVQLVVERLTDSMAGNIRLGVQEILGQNIKGGGSYGSLVKQMRGYIVESGEGSMIRYAKQITSDALNQFSRQYSQALTEDLSLDWFMYVGSNKSTTREFCELLTKKKWIHRSELPGILNGVIDGKKVPINPKTKLWYGAIEGTTVANFQSNAGGHGCDHHLLPVSASMVPAHIRARFE